jgi:hypothetical protein
MGAELLRSYNYDAFTPDKFGPWINFHHSPALGTAAPDFPLWPLDGGETRLSSLWSQYTYLVVEFGSFT